MYLDDEDEKPQRKIFQNALYVQYSPSQYLFEGLPHQHFQEMSLGYFRALQIMEEKPYYVELGAAAKYSWANGISIPSEESRNCNLFTLRIPVSVMYKFYLHKTKEIAVAPYAGAYFRAIVAGKEEGWNACQLGWHVGARFYWERYYIGVSYARDFPDKSKTPSIHECGVHLGVCF